MTNLLARILLAMVMFPLTVLVFIMTILLLFSGGLPSAGGWWAAVFVSGGFASIYWLLLWHQVVRWTPRRIVNTVAASMACVLAGLLAGVVLHGSMGQWPEIEPCIILGGCVAVVLWLAVTVLVWRETPRERAERIRLMSSGAVTCPHCGYNLTGLSQSRCPECGTTFTLDALFAGQRRESVESTCDATGVMLPAEVAARKPTDL